MCLHVCDGFFHAMHVSVSIFRSSPNCLGTVKLFQVHCGMNVICVGLASRAAGFSHCAVLNVAEIIASLYS